MNTIKVPSDVTADSIVGTEWDYITTPLLFQNEGIPKKHGRRYEYPRLLSGHDPNLDRKGLYIWVAKNPDEEVEQRYRFVHVGISERGGSTLAKRTKVHLRGQLEFTDRIHRVDWSEKFGSLGPDLRRSTEDRQNAMEEFLRNLHIIFLFPKNRAIDHIRTMEGVISYAAAYLLDTTQRVGEEDWETTNTLSKNSRWEPTEEGAACVAEMLNHCICGGILPTKPRMK